MFRDALKNILTNKHKPPMDEIRRAAEQEILTSDKAKILRQPGDDADQARIAEFARGNTLFAKRFPYFYVNLSQIAHRAHLNGDPDFRHVAIDLKGQRNAGDAVMEIHVITSSKKVCDNVRGEGLIISMRQHPLPGSLMIPPNVKTGPYIVMQRGILPPNSKLLIAGGHAFAPLYGPDRFQRVLKQLCHDAYVHGVFAPELTQAKAPAQDTKLVRS